MPSPECSATYGWWPYLELRPPCPVSSSIRLNREKIYKLAKNREGEEEDRRYKEIKRLICRIYLYSTVTYGRSPYLLIVNYSFWRGFMSLDTLGFLE
jgi:hypothetical protein